MDGMGNGIEKVCFSQPRLAINKKGVVALPWIVSHSSGGCMCKFIGGTNYKPLEGIVFRTREKVIFFGGMLVLGQFILG